MSLTSDDLYQIKAIIDNSIGSALIPVKGELTALRNDVVDIYGMISELQRDVTEIYGMTSELQAAVFQTP